MNLLTVVTQDKDLIEEIETVLQLFSDWEMKVIGNIEAAWIDFFSHTPVMAVIDLDMYGDYETNSDRRRIFLQGDRTLVIFVSSHPMSQEPKADWVATIRAVDYLKKPVDLDRLVYALSVASKPVPEG